MRRGGRGRNILRGQCQKVPVSAVIDMRRMARARAGNLRNSSGGLVRGVARACFANGLRCYHIAVMHIRNQILERREQHAEEREESRDAAHGRSRQPTANGQREMPLTASDMPIDEVEETALA